MDWIRVLFQGDVGQNLQIADLRERLDQLWDAKSPAAWSQKQQIEGLKEETLDLKLRLVVLIKLLVAKNVLTAQEIASMLASLEPKASKSHQ
jgi:hypothetical protein